MNITKIELENFGPYYDEVTIRPQVEEERPIVLFRGDNDTGKTSLYTGIRFCLYGVESRAERDRFINRTAATEDSGHSRVQLDFKHDGETYIVERGIEFEQVSQPQDREANDWYRSVKTPSETIISPDDPGEDYNTFLNSIIPAYVADYFFFDAEELERFEENHNTEVREAIETVLGIREIENAISDLDDREQKYQQELTQIESTVAEVNKKREQLQDVLEQLNELTGTEGEEGEIDKLREKLETKRSNLQDVQKSLERAKDAENLREDLQDVKDELEESKEAIENKKSKRKDIQRKAGPLVGTQCSRSILNNYQAQGVEGESQVITRVLDKETCICGTDISTKSGKKDYLRNRWHHLMSEENKELISLNSIATRLDLSVPEELERYEELQSDIRSLSNRIENLTSREKSLEDEISTIERQFSEELKSKEESLKQEISKLDNKITEKERKVGELQEKRSKLKSRIDSQEGASENEERLQALGDLASRCKAAMEDLKDEFVESRREDVEEHTSETFMNLTNRPEHYDGLRITENYELRVLVDGVERRIEEQMPSSGQRQIIAYAFIAGLSRYTPRDAPVIIDTPIGRLDPIHKQNLIEYYHEFSDQVMILYQPNELTEADLENLQGRVSNHYVIKIRDDNKSASTIDTYEIGQLLAEGV